MMKRVSQASLAVAAVICSFSAGAAEVEIYGTVDTGLSYERRTADFDPFFTQYSSVTEATTERFAMKSGMNRASRIGIKGSEELGNGMTVSFLLENGFQSDTGALSTSGTLFDREARLTVAGVCGGEMSFGRMSALSAASGTYGIVGGVADALGEWSETLGAANAAFADNSGHTVFDNAVVLKTPDMAGVTVYAMYSFGNGTESAHSSQNDRYGALAVKYAAGPLAVVLEGETYKQKPMRFYTAAGSEIAGTAIELDDTYNISLAASYDFDVVKLHAGYQYSRHAADLKGHDSLGFGTYSKTLNGEVAVGVDSLNERIAHVNGLEGHALTVSAAVPMENSNVYAGLTWAKQEAERTPGLFSRESELEMTTYSVYAAYDYAFSKRTKMYAGASYTRYDYLLSDRNQTGSSANTNNVKVQAGIVHSF